MRGMKRFISVAAIQMEILTLQVNTNLQKAKSLLEDALKGHTLDLVVFPEDCITGPLPYNLEYACDITSKTIVFFQKLARKHRVYIVCGSFIRKKKEGYFNTSLLINREGDIVLEYEKNNLWTPERRYLTAGTSVSAVKTSIGTIGIVICWDLAFPEVFQELALQGVDIVCCPSYWTREDSGSLLKKYPDASAEATMVDALCPARALENECLVIYANGANKAEIFLRTTKITETQIGHTQICAPLYGTVSKLANNKEGVIYYNYDRHLGRDAENRYHLRKDKQKSLVDTNS